MSPKVKAILSYHLLLIVLMGVLSFGFYVLPFEDSEAIARSVFGASVIVIVIMALIALHKAISVKGDGE